MRAFCVLFSLLVTILFASLTNVDGLNLVTGSGFLFIQGNAVLTNLDGLSGLTSANGNTYITHNQLLANIDGLSALTSVSGLGITDNAALINLDGLSAVTSAGFLVVSQNAALTNVDGLSALGEVRDDVEVQNNPSLKFCAGMTTLLDDIDDGAPGPGPGVAGIPDVGGDVLLEGNFPGCNSIDEIIQQYFFKEGFESQP